HHEEPDRGPDPDGDERAPLPLWHLPAHPDGDQASGRRDHEGGSVMHELSRMQFLRGGGSLVIGLSVTGVVPGAARAANNPGATAATHTGALAGPPDPTQIDSWLQVNPDNTVTLFHGWAELGQGTPTAVRMIAAEELRLSLAQVSAAQVDTNVSLS